MDYLEDIGETTKWEFKSAAILENGTKDHLGDQVSAFANSLGGFIAIGIKEVKKGEEFELEACKTLHGKKNNEPMKDYLGKIVSGSVEPPLGSFEVHQLRHDKIGNDFIFVIEIGDSHAAPHQVTDGSGKYYYRVGTESKPAPHQHLELLRNRITRAVIDISRIECGFGIYLGRTRNNFPQPQFALYLQVFVKNISWVSASHWGIHLFAEANPYEWQLRIGECPHISTPICVHAPPRPLLPDETAKLNIPLELYDTSQTKRMPFEVQRYYSQVWRALKIELRPVSQDNVGKIVQFPDHGSVLGNEREEKFVMKLTEAYNSAS